MAGLPTELTARINSKLKDSSIQRLLNINYLIFESLNFLIQNFYVAGAGLEETKVSFIKSINLSLDILLSAVKDILLLKDFLLELKPVTHSTKTNLMAGRH